MSKEIDNFFRDIQNNIINNFNSLEGSKKDVYDDVWNRPDGGGGRSYIIKSGKFFDNCAVNFSSISGNKLPPSALKKILKKMVNFLLQAFLSYRIQKIHLYQPATLIFEFSGYLIKKII